MPSNKSLRRTRLSRGLHPQSVRQLPAPVSSDARLPGESTLYCASFIWESHNYDSEFHRLNDAIDQLARSLPGYLGVESWQAADGSRKCANYYWADLATLKNFSAHPTHLEAKKQYARWYKGYHIIISEVIRSYGDGALSHITPNDRDRTAAQG